MTRRSEAIELRPWVQRYARRRYGPATPPSAGVAWQLLLESVYNSTDLHNDHKCAWQPWVPSSPARSTSALPFLAHVEQRVQQRQARFGFQGPCPATIQLPHFTRISSPLYQVTHGRRAAPSCDVPTSRPALERAEGVPWGLIPQLWYDDAKVRRPTCPSPHSYMHFLINQLSACLSTARPASTAKGLCK